MRCSAKALALPVAMLVAGCLAAGCGSSVQSAINNLPSRTATSTATPTTTSAPTVTPTTTSAPTVTATTTITPTVTPTPPPATATSSVAASPTAGSGSGSLLWLWILLGVVVLVILIALIVRSGRRRSAAAAGWQSRLIDAYAKGSALHDAMSVAESPGAMTAADAGARWSDIQRRADDLTQTLYALREAVPDPGDQARISDTLASLQAVRSAMDAERTPGGAGPAQAEIVRNRLYAFESSLRALRAGDEGHP
jgi:hypothetical protein